MAVKIRLVLVGSKRPFYRIVASDERAPRDGRFLEKIGTYNPMLPKDAENRVTFDETAIKKWHCWCTTYRSCCTFLRKSRYHCCIKP